MALELDTSSSSAALRRAPVGPIPLTNRKLAPALLFAGALALLWLVLAPRTADFAAQAYRSWLFSHEGFVLWDNAWFGGHFLPGYSLVFPPLAALLGTRIVGVLAVLCSVALFAQLMRRFGVAHVRAAAIWFAAAAVGDLFIGRITFALGFMFGLAAVTAYIRGRPNVASVLGVACAASSPVAGLFLALAAVAGASRIGARGAARLAGPALAAVVLMDVVFPDGGTQPFDLAAAGAGLALALLVWRVVDERYTVIRRGALLYAAAIALSYVIPSPMGSNVARLGVLTAGPLVLSTTQQWKRPIVLALCGCLAIWGLWGPVTEFAKTMDNPSTSASYYAPLLRFLERAGAANGRVEVVPTQTHWESVYVAERFALARGWESQLDERYNPLFYHGTLTPEKYRQWLLNTGVRFVALPDVALERWGNKERTLLQHPPAYLRLAWHNANWRVYAVRGAVPLVVGPGRLVGFGSNGFTVRAKKVQPIIVRVNYTRYWRPRGDACVWRAADGWTVVDALRPGVVHVTPDLSIGAVLGGGARCAPGISPSAVGAPQS